MTSDPMRWPWLAWILASLGSFLVLEILGYMKYGRSGTLTAHIQVWSDVHPLIPFGLGVTVGVLAFHFWKAS